MMRNSQGEAPAPAEQVEGKAPLTAKPGRHRERARRRILRGTAALPALFTILNGLAGFASIHFATKDALGAATLTNLAIASWLIFGAMVCDMLDGRLARISRRTSDFGAQLDSLCDVVSFGVAPAMLMLRAVVMALRDNVGQIDSVPSFPGLERIVWCVAAVYVACAALRLARFNVENEPDESAHMMFKGLPSPGAAACIASLVLLFVHLADPQEAGWLSSEWLLKAVGFTVPTMALLTALLMVSSFRYPHIVNQYIRGKRPFGYLVKATVIVVAAFLALYLTATLLAISYVLAGPIRSAWRRLGRGKRQGQDDHDSALC